MPVYTILNKYEVELYKGSSYEFSFQALDEDCNPLDITDLGIIFVCGTVTKDSIDNQQISIIDPLQGTGIVHLHPEDTNAMYDRISFSISTYFGEDNNQFVDGQIRFISPFII